MSEVSLVCCDLSRLAPRVGVTVCLSATHTLSLSRALSLSLSHTLSLIRARSFSLTHTLSFALALSHTSTVSRGRHPPISHADRAWLLSRAEVLPPHPGRTPPPVPESNLRGVQAFGRENPLWKS